jgi:hypothetical protein
VVVGEPQRVTVTLAETVTTTETAPAEAAGEGTLPAPVAEVRAELLAAAEAGDHDRLAALAPEDFSYTFGGEVEGGPAAYWRRLGEEGQDPLGALEAVLRLPYTLTGGIYIWPFAYDARPEEITEYERTLLSEIPGGAEITESGYLGWRAGIDPDGTWLFFIAGD